MKTLATGATGLVGRNLLPLLKDNGAVVGISWIPEDI